VPRRKKLAGWITAPCFTQIFVAGAADSDSENAAEHPGNDVRSQSEDENESSSEEDEEEEVTDAGQLLFKRMSLFQSRSHFIKFIAGVKLRLYRVTQKDVYP